MEASCCGITAEDIYEVKLRLESSRGSVVIDETTGFLLLLIEEKGSLLGASRILGIPYSRVWERINRIESILGEKLVTVSRGRKGARLTETGRFIVEFFKKAYLRLHNSPPRVLSRAGLEEGRAAIVYAGSSDFLVEEAIRDLVKSGVSIEAHWVGSLNGIASILLGEAHVAGIHLREEESGNYNEWVLDKLVRGYNVKLMRGYLRSIGFSSRDKMSINEIVEGLLSGRLRLANRIVGSGSRRLLESIICGEARSCGELLRKIRGWDTEYQTYEDVARAISLGIADVGLVIESVAVRYGLPFTRITWEKFDFIISNNNKINILINKICDKLEDAPIGYRRLEDSCTEIGSEARS